jgi:hypothetical protein
MAFFSLPHYPDRPKPKPPERNNLDLVVSRRMTSNMIRAVWLVVIWGALFAFRSVLMSQEINDPRNPIIGTWDAADGSGRCVVFEYGQFFLKQDDKVLVSGNYTFRNDGTIWTTSKTWDHKTDKEVELHYLTFTASITGDDLILQPSDGAAWHLKRKR